jgi:hypothetical protein
MAFWKTLWGQCGRRGRPLPAPYVTSMVRGIEPKNIVDDDKDRKNFVLRMGDFSFETYTAIVFMLFI